MTYDCPPRAGDHSPWGVIENSEQLCPGVVHVITPSHGGIWLSRERYAEMPPDQRSVDRWYEEDCEAAYVLHHFIGEIAHFPTDSTEKLRKIVESQPFSRIKMHRRTV